MKRKSNALLSLENKDQDTESTIPSLVHQLNKPSIGTFQRSSLLDSVKLFLPQLQKANEDLQTTESIVSIHEDGSNSDLSLVSEPTDDEANDEQQPYIQMNVALGIFEEKKKEKLIEQIGDDDENSDDLPTTTRDSDHDDDLPSIQIPQQETISLKRKREARELEEQLFLNQIVNSVMEPHLKRRRRQEIEPEEDVEEQLQADEE